MPYGQSLVEGIHFSNDIVVLQAMSAIQREKKQMIKKQLPDNKATATPGYPILDNHRK